MSTSRTRKTADSSSAAKKPAAKKAPAKKTAKKTSRKATKASSDSPPRTQTTTSSVSDQTSPRESPPTRPRGRSSAPRAEARPRPSAAQIATDASDQVGAMTGKHVEGVTGVSRSESGWTVEVEVVEVRRIPDTMDVLALYEVTLDDSGALEGYRRLSRYARGASRED